MPFFFIFGKIHAEREVAFAREIRGYYVTLFHSFIVFNWRGRQRSQWKNLNNFCIISRISLNDISRLLHVHFLYRELFQWQLI